MLTCSTESPGCNDTGGNVGCGYAGFDGGLHSEYHFFVRDHLGSVRQVVSAAGEVEQSVG